VLAVFESQTSLAYEHKKELVDDACGLIYYNTLLLSRVYEQKAAAGDLDAIKILQGISPVSPGATSTSSATSTSQTDQSFTAISISCSEPR
jgi:hypothetical protein